MLTLLALLGLMAATRHVAIDHAVDGMVQEGFRGQIVIASGDQIIYDRSAGAAINAETLFYVASITKSFTATAIFKLRDDGRLSLDDPITKYFQAVPADKRAVTIGELLTHTSGYSANYAADGFADRDAAVAAVLSQRMTLVTGKDFHYSNDNYALLGAIVEIASGLRYEDYLQKNVFAPAGVTMRFWGSATPEDMTHLAAMTHPVAERRRQRNWGDLGSSGALTTARDLHRWWVALQNGRILKKASVAEMMAPRVVRPDSTSIASGWFVMKTPAGRDVVFSRGQEDIGHNALILHFKASNITFFITTNSELAGDGWNRIAATRLEAVFFTSPGGKGPNAASSADPRHRTEAADAQVCAGAAGS
jgi:CubicO group peptidase (beta-lactamase class C family)